MKNKKKYIRLIYYDDREWLMDESKLGTPTIHETPKEVVAQIEANLKSDYPDEGFYGLQVIEMTESEFDNLPEFDGF